MTGFRQLICVCIIAIIAAVSTWAIKGSPDRSLRCDPAAIKADEICLQEIPKGTDITWIDARSRKLWQQNGLQGSILWNLDSHEDMNAFEANGVMNIIKHPKVVVYCDDENCGVSRQIANRIKALGLGAEVYILHGGWRALFDAGFIATPNRTP